MTRKKSSPSRVTNTSTSANSAPRAGSYRVALTAGELQLRGSASWIESSQKNGEGTASFDLAGTIYHPARLNGRVGAVWRSGGFSAAGFANYVEGVTSRLTATSEKTASFTTFDTTLRYETAGEGALSGLTVSLSVQNLFDREPPPYAAPATNIVPYDSTNYSAIGRFWNVSIAKHW